MPALTTVPLAPRHVDAVAGAAQQRQVALGLLALPADRPPQQTARQRGECGEGGEFEQRVAQLDAPVGLVNLGGQSDAQQKRQSGPLAKADRAFVAVRGALGEVGTKGRTGRRRALQPRRDDLAVHCARRRDGRGRVAGAPAEIGIAQCHHALGSDQHFGQQTLEVLQWDGGRHRAIQAAVGPVDTPRQHHPPDAGDPALDRLGEMQAGIGPVTQYREEVAVSPAEPGLRIHVRAQHHRGGRVGRPDAGVLGQPAPLELDQRVGDSQHVSALARWAGPCAVAHRKPATPGGVNPRQTPAESAPQQWAGWGGALGRRAGCRPAVSHARTAPPPPAG